MTDERCGSRLNKRPWLTCRSRPVTGYGRCRMHLGLGGGALWRHGTEASQRACLEHLQARRALWNDKRKADGLPYPCRRKSGDAYWTAATVAYCMRLWPNSVGWKRKAALAGALPVSMAVPNPAMAEALCLWARPNREAVNYLPPCRVQSNHGLEWFTPERIADLERRFPKPGARWRRKLAKLKGETEKFERPSPVAPAEEPAAQPAIPAPPPPPLPMRDPFERLKAEGARKRAEALEARNATRRFNAKHGWNMP